MIKPTGALPKIVAVRAIAARFWLPVLKHIVLYYLIEKSNLKL